MIMHIITFDPLVELLFIYYIFIPLAQKIHEIHMALDWGEQFWQLAHFQTSWHPLCRPINRVNKNRTINLARHVQEGKKMEYHFKL